MSAAWSKTCWVWWIRLYMSDIKFLQIISTTRTNPLMKASCNINRHIRENLITISLSLSITKPSTRTK